VYSITQKASFDQLGALYQAILMVKEHDNYPVVVIGNKADLEEKRMVTTQQGKDFAKRIGAPFFETSGK
jgi:GTPase KRas protein